MEYTSDAILKLNGDDVFKGQPRSNGTLKLIHDYSLTTGYSRLVISPALAATGVEGVPFGCGVWFDMNRKAVEPNVVYAGIPTATGADPVFAGIIAYEQALASGQPTQNNKVMPHNKGKIVKRGFVEFKVALKATAGPIYTELLYPDVTLPLNMYVVDATGLPVFAASVLSGEDWTYVGKVLILDPDEQSWTVSVEF
jgi:hypothetical protein